MAMKIAHYFINNAFTIHITMMVLYIIYNVPIDGFSIVHVQTHPTNVYLLPTFYS